MNINDLLIPLLTVLASGISAAVVTHILNSRKEERIFIRQKLEELHLALYRYGKCIRCGFLPFLRAMAGELDYNQATAIFIDAAEGKDPDALPTVERLIGIYFPDLEPELKAIITSRDKLNELQHAYKQDYKKGIVSNGPWLAPFREEYIRNGDLIEELKRKIVEHPIKTTKRMPMTLSTRL